VTTVCLFFFVIGRVLQHILIPLVKEENLSDNVID